MDGALRFAVGDRVRCKTSAAQWKRGTVVKLNYRDDRWPEGRSAPYQIELETGVLIYAPQDMDSLVRADDGMEEITNAAEIHVCQAGPCRRAGGEAVLLEIEELARNVGGVVVQSSGCLGNCNNAPNALVVAEESEQMYAKLCDLSATAQVVERASGRVPNLDDAEMVVRLQRARRLRVRMEARDESKWNLALSGLAEDVDKAEDDEERAELVQEYAELLAAAGMGDKALEVLSTVAPSLEDVSLADVPGLRLLLDQAKMLARLGRRSRVEAIRSRVDQLRSLFPRERSIKAQVVEMLAKTSADCPTERPADPPCVRIQDYARWRIDAITPVSKHSAIYRFRSDDALRGTPIRKGRGGRTVWSKTWHTTLLAQVGEPRNTEGPLPWIERDYTPISTARDWEQGRCDILIKIYLEPAGIATEWLHRITTGISAADITDAAAGTAAEGSAGAGAAGAGGTGGAGAAGAGAIVWLSRPMKTLHVPSLALDEKYMNRKHASILLLVAGTGVVAVPQVLHHANAATCFGASPPIKQPVSVMYTCRSDDALLIPELADLCRQGSLARCTVLLTASQAGATPFPAVADTDVVAAFSGLDHAACVDARLSVELLRAELFYLDKPMRVVISGPESFNRACKTMLKQIDDALGAEAVTVLSA